MEGVELAEEVVAFREGLDGGTSALLDDFDCMRFLRARQMDVPKAVIMATAWGVWAVSPLAGSRDGRTPLTILDDVDDMHEPIYSKYCPHFMEGEDKAGRPIYWEQTGDGSQHFYQLKEILSHDELVARHIRIQQMMTCRLKYCSDKHDRRIEKMISVNNFSNLSYSPDLDSIKFAIAALTCDQDNFPERLQTVYAINCPWYATALYAMISPFMDDVTKTKIRILGTDYYETLLEEISADNIPVELGGNMETTWAWPFSETSGCSPDQIEMYRYAPAGDVAEESDEEISHIGDAHDKIDDIS
jgi:hypothetical protein